MMRDLFSHIHASSLNIFMEGELISWAYFENTLGKSKIRSGQFNFDPQKLIEIKKNLPRKPSRITLILPRQEILSRTLKLPAPDPHEISKLIASRLPQEIPYTLNEIVYTISSTRFLEDHNTEIRILWTLKSNVQSKLEILHLLDYDPDQILSSSQVLHCGYLALKEKKEETPDSIFLLHLGEKESELLAIQNKNILSTRSIKKELAQILETPEELQPELHSLLETAEKETLEKPLAIFITGAGAGSSFSEWISKKTGIPIQRLDGPSLPEPLITESVAFLLGDVSSLALTGFSSEDLKEQQQGRRKSKLLRQILSLGVTFILVSLAGLWLNVSAKEIYKAKLEKFWQKLSPDAKQVLRIAREIKFFQEFQKEKAIPLEFLSELPVLLPQEISLTQFDYDQETGFQIRGIGNNHEAILILLKGIKKLPYIAKADFDFSTRRKQTGREYFEFQISAVPEKITWRGK